MKIIDTKTGTSIDAAVAAVESTCPICDEATRVTLSEYIDILCDLDEDERPEGVNVMCEACGRIGRAIKVRDMTDVERIKQVRKVLGV